MTTLRLLRLVPDAFDVLARIGLAVRLTRRSLRDAGTDACDIAERRPFLDTDASWKEIPKEPVRNEPKRRI